MEFIEVTAKNLSDAITSACQQLSVTSDRLYYEVIDEGSSGFLGIGVKPVVIKASVKEKEAEVKKTNTVNTAKENIKETVKEVAKQPENKAVEKVEKTAEVKEEVKKDNASENKKVSDGTVEKAAEIFLKDVFQAMSMTVSVQTKYDPSENTLDIDLSGEPLTPCSILYLW